MTLLPPNEPTLVTSVVKNSEFQATWTFDKPVTVQDTFPDTNLQLTIVGGGLQGANEVATGGPNECIAFYTQPILAGGAWTIPAAPDAVVGNEAPILVPQSGSGLTPPDTVVTIADRLTFFIVAWTFDRPVTALIGVPEPNLQVEKATGGMQGAASMQEQGPNLIWATYASQIKTSGGLWSIPALTTKCVGDESPIAFPQNGVLI